MTERIQVLNQLMDLFLFGIMAVIKAQIGYKFLKFLNCHNNVKLLLKYNEYKIINTNIRKYYNGIKSRKLIK